MRTGQNEAIRERELTSGRSPAAIVIATLVILLCGYALFEAALKALGQDPLIATPETWWTWISLLPGDLNPLGLVATGLAAMLLGLVFLTHGTRRGRLARHSMGCDGAVLIVDDQVLAAALARRARIEASVGPGQVLVVISHERIDVQIRPTSGTPIVPAVVLSGLEEELRINAVEPMPVINVRVSESGVIGQ